MINVSTLPESARDTDESLLASIAAGLHVPLRIVLPTSWVGHIPFASWIIAALKPRVVVELGVHTGNSFFTFAEAAARGGLPTMLYGIDTWAGDDHAGVYAEDVFTDVSAIAASRFPDHVRLMRKFFEDAVEDFEDGSVDLLHIDGLHTYEAVKGDFATWRTKLSDRAVVLFHDIAVTKEGFGVGEFWSEVRENFPHFAFEHSNGLGVLLVGPRVPARINVFAISTPAREGFVGLLSKLGDFLESSIRHGPDVETLPVNPSLDPPRIYVAANGLFDEGSAVNAHPLAGAAGALRCAIGPIVDVDQLALRIDPMNQVGIRGIHRILLSGPGSAIPIELAPTHDDRRQRLSIVTVEKGMLFVATGDDSQWFPKLSAEAREMFRTGATLLFEPIAASNASLGRMLIESVHTLIAPLDARLGELRERQLAQSLVEADYDEATVSKLQGRLLEEQEKVVASLAEAALNAKAVEDMTALLSRVDAEKLAQSRAFEDELAQTQRLFDAERSAWSQKYETSRSEWMIERASLLEIADATAARLGQMEKSDSNLDSCLTALLEAASLTQTHTDHSYLVLDDALRALDAAASESRSSAGAIARSLVFANELSKGRHLVKLRRQAVSKLSGMAARGFSPDLCLEPLHGLVPLDASAKRWHSIDGDPQFAFGELCGYAGQWVEITVGLAFDEEPSGSPVIYMDRGEGMSESGSIALPRPAPDTGISTIVLAVPADLRFARFDPCAAAISFTVTTFKLRQISKFTAMRSMVRTMRHSGRLRHLRDTYVPQWRSMHSATARRNVKNAFVDAYRVALRTRSYDYSEWIRRFEPQPSSFSALASERLQWARNPLISVLMPVYETPARYLREAIESVIKQEYPHWELCIADDASKTPHVRRVLAEFEKSDARIKVVYRSVNGHISAASNSALELATGEFIALLDHDDRLHPLALHYVAEAIVRSPDARMIYSDEDKLDSASLRNGPYFKSDFNYELFLAQNMVSHLGCYSTETVRKVGGFRVGMEGSQDWDLGLRVYEDVGSTAIRHIPRVLYHWREIPGSTAVSSEEKPYAQLAGRRAVEDHVRRQSIDATVGPAPGLPVWNRVNYAVPSSHPKVSIVIPTRDRVDLLKTCVQSIFALTTYENYEIVIVDNGSIENETTEYLASLVTDRVKVIRDDSPFNYSRLNNLAVEKTSGELICLLNNDIEVVSPDWLEEMVSIVSQKSVGIVGARLWYPDLRIQHAGVILGIGGIASHSHLFKPKGDHGYFGRAGLHQQLSAVTGACLLITRKLWQELGGLDETLAVAFNDIDLCLRAGEKGYRTVWTPYAELIHHESVSRGADDTPEKIARFEAEQDRMRKRWGAKLQLDPFYSPNLTLAAEDFSLSWEPRIH